MGYNKGYGIYRINTTEFPAPQTEWEEQTIEGGLNGLPINSSYRKHRWALGELHAALAELLYSLYSDQQIGNNQLAELETDPYDASQGTDTYGTTVYTDFVITSVSQRRRGYPNYQDVTIEFEVYVQ